ncbi:hypothetical protein [Lysinibacillus fusiformis]|uniref:hypothetical protein n=1 Tax=Lysinibacillus fusiformis TaxID=28031 RepID=UPI0023A95E63|nr:hypothetical protein [Lysinibacillus fusiformis]WEA37527.1 hypothetical protein PWJ66_12640 [Lysinibacillus fusiformis]
MSNICPVCGFEELEKQPYNEFSNPSFEICGCCGFQFGFDDMSETISYEVFRNNWIENNCEWFNEDKKPQNGDYRDQLKNIQSI